MNRPETTVPARGRRPGGVDVARLAGVSQKTVSRVFNNEPHVTERIRRRVLAAAEELGYRPNGAARALNTGRTRRIGILLAGLPYYGPVAQLAALERAARATGYSLVVVHAFEDDARGVGTAVRSAIDHGIDAMVLVEPMEIEGVHISLDVPVVTLRNFAGLVAPHVILTEDFGAAAARQATEHLLGLGHREIHHISGPARWWAGRDRLQGWQDAMDAAGADSSSVSTGDWSPRAGYDAGRRIAARRDITAVFAANDEMAIGLMQALHDAGRRVPDDVSVVGFDDVPAASYLRPGLTTVAQEFDVMATAALNRLFRYLDEGSQAADPALARPRLVVRQSTAPPARPPV